MQTADVIMEYMHEHDLCHCSKSASYDPDNMPEGSSDQCIAIGHADELANRLARNNLLK